MKTTSFNKYLSNYIYDNLVPKNNTFRKLNKIINWHELGFDLEILAKNKRGGRPRYAPVMLIKMLFLAYVYELSDQETENLCVQNITCKYFIGLDITQRSPDRSTVSAFRVEVEKQFGNDWFGKIFTRIKADAKKAGLNFEKLRILTS